MVGRIVTWFILIAIIAYMFNIDVRAIVDSSGVSQWFTEHLGSAQAGV